jgi:hypothetical protein
MNKLLYFTGSLLIVILASCSDIISKDITGEAVTALSPVTGDTVSSYSQLFWWEEIEGAEEYHLQIVKPSFSSIQQLVLDTTVQTDRFSFTLQPGTYQWRVRAQNNAGYTEYTVNTLTVDSTLDLTSQTVQLISPANNATVSDLARSFKWYAMPFADAYTLQVLTMNNSTIYINSNITADSASYTFAAFGTYKWRVWATNSASSSHYSEYIINVQPSISSPYTPANNDTVLIASVNMSWTRPAGIVSDSLIISEDPSFATIVHSALHTNTTYTFTAVPGRDYYWKLRSKASSGSMSGYSNTFRFYVN